MRRVLSVLLVALGRPIIGRGCWIEPLMQATNGLGDVEELERDVIEPHREDAGHRRSFP
jgi:hypothetical protein